MSDDQSLRDYAALSPRQREILRAKAAETFLADRMVKIAESALKPEYEIQLQDISENLARLTDERAPNAGDFMSALQALLREKKREGANSVEVQGLGVVVLE